MDDEPAPKDQSLTRVDQFALGIMQGLMSRSRDYGQHPEYVDDSVAIAYAAAKRMEEVRLNYQA